MPPPALSLALTGLELPTTRDLTGFDRLKALIAHISAAQKSPNIRAIHLLGTWSGGKGIRPADLDRSGRRDLAALLRRSELALSGLDLRIPTEHFADPTHAERAMAAVMEAVELAADLARLGEMGIVTSRMIGPGPFVGIELPANSLSTVTDTLASHADTRGVALADFGLAAQPSSAANPATKAAPSTPASAAHLIGRGIDPAAMLARGDDPVAAVFASSRSTASATAGTIAGARLSDSARGARVPPGSREGHLDLRAYAAALLATNYPRHVTLDLQGIPDQDRAIPHAAEAWNS